MQYQSIESNSNEIQKMIYDMNNELIKLQKKVISMKKKIGDENNTEDDI